jgi:hypothetical protein
MLRLHRCLLLFAAAPVFGLAATKNCVPIEEAGKLANKDACVAAHVYDVVQLADGTRFLDVCAPQTPDDACRFTIVSLKDDRDEVGELAQYRGMDIQIRGLVQSMHGRSGMVLSHARQFHGGPPKFRPNPALARGFDGGQARPPIADPNLRAQGAGRAFMNTRKQETLPGR